MQVCGTNVTLCSRITHQSARSLVSHVQWDATLEVHWCVMQCTPLFFCTTLAEHLCVLCFFCGPTSTIRTHSWLSEVSNAFFRKTNLPPEAALEQKTKSTHATQRCLEQKNAARSVCRKLRIVVLCWSPWKSPMDSPSPPGLPFPQDSPWDSPRLSQNSPRLSRNFPSTPRASPRVHPRLRGTPLPVPGGSSPWNSRHGFFPGRANSR